MLLRKSQEEEVRCVKVWFGLRCMTVSGIVISFLMFLSLSRFSPFGRDIGEQTQIHVEFH